MSNVVKKEGCLRSNNIKRNNLYVVFSKKEYGLGVWQFVYTYEEGLCSSLTSYMGRIRKNNPPTDYKKGDMI